METLQTKHETTIHSNGSKWYGQEPDSIKKLIEVLKANTIEESFFTHFKHDGKQYQHCPIDNSINGENVIFFGNFEEVSHVFRITTNDPQIIEKLSKAIKENKGWKKYYAKNLI